MLHLIFIKKLLGKSHNGTSRKQIYKVTKLKIFIAYLILQINSNHTLTYK